MEQKTNFHAPIAEIRKLIFFLPPWKQFHLHDISTLCYDKLLLIIVKSTISDP